jgi:predicted amidophosphoribosyltransferase
MKTKHKHLAREYKTIEAMIGLYCRDLHGAKNNQLCVACGELLAYAKARLDKCPYQEQKPVCAKCPIHCYKPEVRGKIRAVMRYAGPRMLKHHPVLAIRHLLHDHREVPAPQKS